jgi:hypothetical protein
MLGAYVARRERQSLATISDLYNILAGVAELVDAADSKSAVSDNVRVRVPP